VAQYNENNPSFDRSSSIHDEPQNKSAGFVESLKEQGKEQLDAEKRSIADQATRLANVVQRVTEELNRSDLRGVASYAAQLASKMKTFADSLRSRSIEDVVDDTRRLARRRPEMFFLGAIGDGVLLSRFFKASERKQMRSRANENTYRSAWGDVAPARGRSASTTTADNLAGGGV